MAGVLRSGWLVVAGCFLSGALAVQPADAAVGNLSREQVAAADGSYLLDSSAQVELRFIQEDGPESGHVRVVITPETRALTLLEARSTAQQAFLKTLQEPGLGGPLSRITVVVRLLPASHPDPGLAEQVIMFQHKGGRDWAVLPID
jgi:hypothetical protein